MPQGENGKAVRQGEGAKMLQTTETRNRNLAFCENPQNREKNGWETEKTNCLKSVARRF